MSGTDHILGAAAVFHGAASGDHSRVYICSYDRDWKSDRLLNFENRERRKEVVWTI